MGTFRDYLNESIKEYNYRVKTILPLDNDAMDKMESILRKYDLQDVSSARKTPLQEHPLEFYNERNKEVYIVDVVLGMPISSFVLRSELQDVLNTYEHAIVVRAENDPIELETQNINDKDDNYETKLSTDSEYNKNEQVDEDPSYGDEFNQKFLSRIARARVQLQSDVAAEKASFNDGHDGVKPHYGKGSDRNKRDMARTGNFDDDRNAKDGVR